MNTDLKQKSKNKNEKQWKRRENKEQTNNKNNYNNNAFFFKNQMPGYLLSKNQQFLSLRMLIPQKESKLYWGNYGGKEKNQ